MVGANPSNDLRLEDSFVAVEQYVDHQWMRIRDDSDWDLIFHWKRTNSVLGTSEVRVEWEIGDGMPLGKYRIRYWGASKTPVTGAIVQFEGMSGTFIVR